MNTSSHDQGGFEFPCEIPLKAMGKHDPGFSTAVTEIIQRHVTVNPQQVRSTSSTKGNYLSVTVTVEISSREQLEQIYQDLNAHPDVVWTL